MPETIASSEPAALVATGWRQRLMAGLAKTRAAFSQPLGALLGGRRLDAAALETIEETLLLADCGVAATQYLIETLQQRHKQTPDVPTQVLLRTLFAELLLPLQQPLQTQDAHPFVIMLAGVNGAGKTTSIGKLAHYFHAANQRVLFAAGDTFRAAAREQLAEWGRRNEVTVIAQESADPAAVIFDAIHAAKARKIDIVLADTAGRLPTQLHLMEEIGKVRRVIAKAMPGAPHEVLLVLDANTGQNAVAQVQAFDRAIGVSGLVVTKLDGSAKGGVLAAIARQCPKPVRFIGVGEGLSDLQPFSAQAFAEALFADNAGAVGMSQ